MHKVLIMTALSVLSTFSAVRAAAPPAVMSVWPKLAPGETTRNDGRDVTAAPGGVVMRTDVTHPTLQIYRASGIGPHPLVMVCPGGGYGVLAYKLEGSDIATWLNSIGVSVAVLYYRTPNKREAAFSDAQRAMSLLRSQALELNIDPNRVGVMGFSAGGHLAMRLASHYVIRSYARVDDADDVSCRPDFAIGIYPAYLSDTPDRDVAPEVKPHSGMPPIFLMQTQDDQYLCAPIYATALEDVGVSVKCVVYGLGGHGYGLHLPQNKPAHMWPDELISWLVNRGVIDKKYLEVTKD